jgi:CRP-like cAMP-binding protein
MLYFLAKGDCEVYVLNEKKAEVFVKQLRPGSLFGEVALVTNGKRSASVKSRNYCTVAGLSEDKFKEFCD